MTYRQFTLHRLAYGVRKMISTRFLEEYPGMRVEVAASEVAEGFAVYLKASVLGMRRETDVEIDAPDGRWQAIRYALGLRYRKRKIRLEASVLFPHLPTAADSITFLEWYDDARSV